HRPHPGAGGGQAPRRPGRPYSCRTRRRGGARPAARRAHHRRPAPRRRARPAGLPERGGTGHPRPRRQPEHRRRRTTLRRGDHDPDPRRTGDRHQHHQARRRDLAADQHREHARPGRHAHLRGRRARQPAADARQRPARPARTRRGDRRRRAVRRQRRVPRDGDGARQMIRVIVVDDQTLVRQGIRSLLDLTDDIEVVGEADDGMAALAAIEEHDPDVVLLALRMPRHDGLWTLEALRERDGEPPAVLVLTTFDSDTLVLDAMRAGAGGYLLKDVTLERLTKAIRVLAGGGTLISPSITDRLLRAVHRRRPPGEPDLPVIQQLTERELEVLRLVAEGYSNREIAQALFLAEGTVKNHVSTVLLKLGARDRTNAVLRALHAHVLD